ncbi:EGF-like, conserved site [Ostreococcus tauri]|uniref:EGF-like, conserved site n=1 Tax=Ostreococcus tauri TaxID=70448 RepID=A0A090M834_OSTTA|nr:EGF-like, conserved site [Ostreococcus tauri]CEG01198.1 EGF-like, conserved site [Ostreococcus tauri]|eukprot:XP_003075285.2 EGF-like, conserved site [Ostreococcus tauri]
MATPTTARDGRLARWMIARTTTTVRAAAGRVAYGARGEDRRRAATRGTTPRRAAAAAAPTTGASLGACAHGYRSASDPELGCVCGHGYTGERCEIDSIPSCDRSETLTCAYVFSNWGDVFNYQSCACVSECEKVLKREHNLTDDEWWRVSRERPENARVCVDSRGRKVDMFTREVVADPREIKDKDMGMHHHNVCTHNCFGRGACKDRVCYCEPGRFGLLCQFDAEDVLPDTIQASVGTKLDGKREMRIEYYDGLSSHARIPLFTKAFYLDIKKEHLGEDDLHEQSHIEASMYATAVHLAETIVEDRWKRTLLTPRSGTHRFIPFFPTNIGANVGSVELYLPNVVRQLPNNDGDDDPWYIFVSMQDRGFCSIDRLRGMLPPRSIVVHSFGWQRFPGAQDTKATARCHQPDFDVVIPARRHPNQAPFDEKDFDPSSKNGPMLFFNGGVRKKADQCSGERLLQNRLSCMDEYSQGVRMYVVDTFQNVSGFSINEPHGGDSWSRETMKTAKYCLVAGGHGFDMRLVDGIARGCVPLLTAIQMSYPYDNVLDYSKFALNIGDRWGETSDKLQDLPNTLEKAYAKGDHGDMVRRLRYVHEVYIMEDELTDEEYREAHPNNVTDAGLATALASIAMVTNVVLPPYFRTTLCHVAYDFLDGRGHEIFKKDALDSFHCSQAERRAV